MVKERIKILHLLQSNKFSGAENVVCQIIEICKDEQIEMAYSSPEGPIRKTLEGMDITYLPLKKISLIELFLLKRKYKPDVIHTHDTKMTFLGFIITIFTKTKLISHIHGNHFNLRKLNLKSFLLLISSLKTDVIFWVSKGSLTDYYFKEIVSKKSRVLPNIIDKEKLFKKLELDSNIYEFDGIFLGRLNDIKDPLRALDIIRRVTLEIPSYKFVVVGEGELFSKCELFIKKHNLSSNISLYGFKENPLKILKNSKVLLMTSKYEGTPMVALEAISLSIPIVSTPVDGIVDMINDDETGFISEDDDLIVKKLIQIYHDEKYREFLSKNCFEKSELLMNKDEYRKKLLEVYLSDR
ncbi:glycosyltransferase [Streptococcus uberis]|uniref:glycosyltransferase n=1 Tax=Streptococcus uberis TaxID=1349 RepID=UPI003891911E